MKTQKNKYDIKDEFPNFNKSKLFAQAVKFVDKHRRSDNKPLVGNVNENRMDTASAEELANWAQNDRVFYTRWATPIISNLQKKNAKKVYDQNAAIRSWLKAAEAAADLYAKEFAGPKVKGKDLFSATVIQLTAKILANDYEEEIFYEA